MFKSLAKNAQNQAEFKKSLTRYITPLIGFTAVYLTTISSSDYSDWLMLLLTILEIAAATISIYGSAMLANPNSLSRYYEKFY
ncbi:hypothetical protein [Streptococcus sobrinus]|uniref:hypothetical protein n=1 Tax=Streptococcus sobrinus TaxID=1310 RepID=UPI000377BA8C|nr:hypothetical protein [Streptococcus sobrinus]